MQPSQPIPMTPTPYGAPPAPARRRVVIARMGIMSVAKIYGLTMALMGLIVGVFFGLMVAVVGASAADSGTLGGLGMFAIVVFPILYGGMGFIAGIIAAAFYNLIANWVGGVALEVE